jgi:hypothetical protein
VIALGAKFLDLEESLRNIKIVFKRGYETYKNYKIFIKIQLVQKYENWIVLPNWYGSWE